MQLRPVFPTFPLHPASLRYLRRLFTPLFLAQLFSSLHRHTQAPHSVISLYDSSISSQKPPPSPKLSFCRRIRHLGFTGTGSTKPTSYRNPERELEKNKVSYDIVWKTVSIYNLHLLGEQGDISDEGMFNILDSDGILERWTLLIFMTR